MAAAAQAPSRPPADRAFTLKQDAEVVASINAGCARCDWGSPGREAAVLELSLDGAYSQHLILTRGDTPAVYRVMLGRVSAGPHHLRIVRDETRSAKDAGDVTIGSVEFVPFASDAPEYPWLSQAPMLRARPGTVEKFSDAPLLMYAETDVTGEQGTPYHYQYTVIFTNEDGGTPTDRLMATWGRTTDIEFVYGITPAGSGAAAREEIQAEGHKWIPFAGPRVGTHPVLWVATENNMVADHGPDDAVRYAPAPEMVALGRTSRESVMDARPWTYAITSAEMVREHRVDPHATPGSGRIVDPRRYATVEACGTVQDATLAFDIGFRDSTGTMQWIGTDTDPKFRIARGGCFRGGAPLPEGTTVDALKQIRVRAYTRPARAGEAPLPAGSGSVAIAEVTKVFMLDEHFQPAVAPLLHWSGPSVRVTTDGTPTTIVVIVDKAAPARDRN